MCAVALQVLSHNLYTVLGIPHDPAALEEHFRDDDDGPVSSQGYMPYLNKYILDKVHSLAIHSHTLVVAILFWDPGFLCHSVQDNMFVHVYEGIYVPPALRIRAFWTFFLILFLCCAGRYGIHHKLSLTSNILAFLDAIVSDLSPLCKVVEGTFIKENVDELCWTLTAKKNYRPEGKSILPGKDAFRLWCLFIFLSEDRYPLVIIPDEVRFIFFTVLNASQYLK